MRSSLGSAFLESHQWKWDYNQSALRLAIAAVVIAAASGITLRPAQAIDTGGSLSNTGTATINMVPTVTIVPRTVSSGTAGTVIKEDIYLDNPNPPGGVGPLTGFNLALTYDSTALSTASDGSGIHPGTALPIAGGEI